MAARIYPNFTAAKYNRRLASKSDISDFGCELAVQP
jgi:hypothetical protein